MSRPTLKALYAKDKHRGGRARNPVGKKLATWSPGATVIESRNSDGKTVAWYVYRCVHCRKYAGEHADGYCLFAPTKFQEMTAEEDAAAFPPEPSLSSAPSGPNAAKYWYDALPSLRGVPVDTAFLDQLNWLGWLD